MDNSLSSPDSSVAAIAYDRKANRLYYAPMNIDQLRYIDLSTMESVAVPEQFFSSAGKYDFRNAGPINRMVIRGFIIFAYWMKKTMSLALKSLS
jgi:hypothetical protein